MVLRREVIERRLEELDATLGRLARHRDVSYEDYRNDPDLQWIVERGLLNAASLEFDVADHVLLIAAETYVRAEGSERRRDREIDDLVHLVAHELAHYQQAAYDVERYQRSNSLLARAIKEGAADYVAELLTGAHINPVAHAYGNRHEWNLWSRFRCEMDTTDTGDWFFARPRDPAWPNDLGYYVGYRIAALRYAQETSSDRALAALLRVDDYDVFLRESGYEAYLEEREGRRFAYCT